VGGGEALKIGNRLDVPNDDAAHAHIGRLACQKSVNPWLMLARDRPACGPPTLGSVPLGRDRPTVVMCGATASRKAEGGRFGGGWLAVGQPGLWGLILNCAFRDVETRGSR